MLRATLGSAGLDLAARQDMILSRIDGVQLVSTSVRGTLPSASMGLLNGRSSNFKYGFEVLPWVIDADFEGEVKVMVKATQETVIIYKGERIAQLLLLQYLKLPNPVMKKERREGQFGSSEVVAWIEDISKNRPFKTFS